MKPYERRAAQRAIESAAQMAWTWISAAVPRRRGVDRRDASLPLTGGARDLAGFSGRPGRSPPPCLY